MNTTLKAPSDQAATASRAPADSTARTLIALLLARLATRWRAVTRDDRGGETIQTVILTAGLALLAVVVVAAVTGGVGKFLNVINNLTP